MASACAVVVGLCAHGLTIARALHKSGISVLGLEADSSLPGVATKTAEVKIVRDINGPGLIDALVSLAPSISTTATPVLFLTNDTMIATVDEHYARLEKLYRISWGSSRAEITPLLRKAQIEKRCQETGLLYPKTCVINDERDLAMLNSSLRFPIIFKPDRPISTYKTLLVADADQLKRAWDKVKFSLPAIAQEFILGADSTIHFEALYMTHGDVVARFEGRKLRSRPMGHTTVAISESNDETHALTRQYFGGLRLSGPVSLEIKRDEESNFWVIEPTVGRTDFWVGLCISDGIDLPLVEYLNENGQCPNPGTQSNQTLWINGERDPAALIWLIMRHSRYILKMRIVGVFLDRHDIHPWVIWVIAFVRRLPGRAINRCKSLINSALVHGHDRLNG
jgi:predicted ATP-grasp superfamily ATP-dependent carboligase